MHVFYVSFKCSSIKTYMKEIYILISKVQEKEIKRNVRKKV